MILNAPPILHFVEVVEHFIAPNDSSEEAVEHIVAYALTAAPLTYRDGQAVHESLFFQAEERFALPHLLLDVIYQFCQLGIKRWLRIMIIIYTTATSFPVAHAILPV